MTDMQFLIALILTLLLLGFAAIGLAEVLKRVCAHTCLAANVCLVFVALCLAAMVYLPAPLSFQDEFPEGCEGVLVEFDQKVLLGGCRYSDGYIIWDSMDQVIREYPDEEGQLLVRKVYLAWQVNSTLRRRFLESTLRGESEI